MQCSSRSCLFNAPPLGEINADFSGIDWVVVGAMSGTQQPDGKRVPGFAPEFSWVAKIVEQAKRDRCQVYLKPNLLEQTSDQWPGMKLVEGRGSRKYTDEGAVTAALQAAGIDDGVIFKRSLNPITHLERALGKKEFQAIVGPLVQKAPGKPKLVVEDDGRPAIEGTAADFD